ncbi:MAG: PilZ domain-containing protein [Phycisphaerae bacterium]
MSKLGPNIATIDEGYWRRFLLRAIAPQPKADIQRGAPRYPYCTEIKLTFDDAGHVSTRSLTSLNVSVSGITAKGGLEIPMDSEVLLEMNPEGVPFVVRGRIVHCTQTVGGYKIGIDLMFSEEPGE